jgi:hypothetical protein
MTAAMTLTYRAPWSTALKWISVLATLLLLGVSFLLPAPPEYPPLFWFVRLLGPVILTGTALFTVRGFEIQGGALFVQRLFWKTRIPIATLNAVEYRPGAFGWAIRTFGNGGLFSFSGWFYQKPLGSFQAFGTRTTDAIILKFSNRKPIVVTPETPEAFAKAIREEAMAQNRTANG